MQDFCDRHRIVRDDCMRLMLIVEELFTNSVEHGYRAENEGPIRVVLAVEGGAVALLYEDSAPRYDPLTRLGRFTRQSHTTRSSRARRVASAYTL